MITSRKARAGALCVAAAALTLTAAGCGSDSGGSSGAAPVPSANGQAVSAQPTSLGTILVDGRGHTVYQFANDRSGTSTCTGSCAADWPFVPAPTPVPASLPGVTGQLGTTTRDGGEHQLTVAGHPVYTFAGDSAPGQTNGQNQNLNGGVWTVLSGAGAPVTATATRGPAGPGY